MMVVVVFGLGGLGYVLLIRRICKGNVEYHYNNEDDPRPPRTYNDVPYSISGSYFESGGVR